MGSLKECASKLLTPIACILTLDSLLATYTVQRPLRADRDRQSLACGSHLAADWRAQPAHPSRDASNPTRQSTAPPPRRWPDRRTSCFRLGMYPPETDLLAPALVVRIALLPERPPFAHVSFRSTHDHDVAGHSLKSIYLRTEKLTVVSCFEPLAALLRSPEVGALQIAMPLTGRRTAHDVPAVGKKSW